MRKFPITAILENIRSAHNVGAMLRTADGANIQDMYLLGITPYPPHERVLKTALGAENSVAWHHEKNSAAALEELAEKMTLVAVEITENAKIYFNNTFSKPVGVIFGNEITGVSESALKLSNQVIKIPMFGKKTSLNVATSFGIIIYEIIRQWQQHA
ncbi:MAG TPA: TrmH family RNA methyltransferase [Candidatus Dojkabacteria bacterium]|nr:TrmH family RNA methyltransferase [Candidatus Dojkabacteria bacterium]